MGSRPGSLSSTVPCTSGGQSPQPVFIWFALCSSREEVKQVGTKRFQVFASFSCWCADGCGCQHQTDDLTQTPDLAATNSSPLVPVSRCPDSTAHRGAAHRCQFHHQCGCVRTAAAARFSWRSGARAPAPARACTHAKRVKQAVMRKR